MRKNEYVKEAKTSDAVEILYRRHYRGKPERIEQLKEARDQDQLARQILELKEQAGLTQARLAKLIVSEKKKLQPV